MSTEIARLHATIGADVSGLEGGLARAKAGLQGLSSPMQGIKGGLTDLGRAAGIAGLGLSAVGAAAFKLSLDASRVDGMMEGLDRRMKGMGSSADQMMSSLRRASQGMLSDAELIRGANRALLLIGEQAANKLPQLMAIAVRASREMGESQEYMWNSIVTGIGRASPRILDNLGMVINETTVYEQFAATLGKTADQLTSVEEKTALLNYTIQWGTSTFGDLGGEMGGLASDAARLRAELKNIGDDIGSILIPAIQPVVAELGQIVAAFGALPAETQKSMMGMAGALLLGAAAVKALGIEVIGILALIAAVPAAIGAMKDYVGQLAKQDLAYKPPLAPDWAFPEGMGFQQFNAPEAEYPDFGKLFAERIKQELAAAWNVARSGMAELGGGMGGVEQIQAIMAIQEKYRGLANATKLIQEEFDATYGAIKPLSAALDGYSQSTMRAASAELALVRSMTVPELRARVEVLTQLRARSEAEMLATKEGTAAYEEARAVFENYDMQVQMATLRLDELGEAHKAAAGGAKEQAQALQQAIAAMVGSHPLVISLTNALSGMRAESQAAQAAQRGMATAIHYASNALRDAQERVSELSKKLSEAKSRLNELSQPRLTGMGALDAQIQKVQDQLNRIRLGRLGGGFGGLDPSLPTNIRALERLLERLQLQQEVDYGSLLRALQEAANPPEAEISYEEALRQIMETRAEIGNLESGLTAAQAAADAQAQALEGLQEASWQLGQAIQELNQRMQDTESRLALVKQGLELAYTWFGKDREEMLKMGGAAAAQVPIIDRMMMSLLTQFSQNSMGMTDLTTSAIATQVEAIGSYISQVRGYNAEWNSWQWNTPPGMPQPQPIPIPIAQGEPLPAGGGGTGGGGGGGGTDHYDPVTGLYLGHWQKGGYITRSGMAIVHAGETVLPPGRGGGGGGGVIIQRLIINHQGFLMREEDARKLALAERRELQWAVAN